MIYKDAIFSYMNHELRSPLSIIIGTAALASKHIDDAAYIEKSLSRIDTSSKQLLYLIDELKDIEDLKTGRLVLKPDVFTLCDLFYEVTEAAELQISDKKQRLKIHIDKSYQRQILADRARLRQIYFNLLSNASKYTYEYGEIEFRVSGKISNDMINTVVSVKDNGIGMSEEFQKHMFEPFARENDILNVSGTGIGLALCKEIVDLMGGDIKCESSPGKGTAFTVMLDLQIF